MKLIPVGLRIENVARDSWVKFTFLTPNVEWSIGNASRDGLGLSCNSRDLLRTQEVRLQYMEIIGPSLSLKTTPDFGTVPLEFTLYVAIPDDVDFLETYCEFNDGASVCAEFGDLKPQKWKCGRNSAVVATVLPDIRQVKLFVHGANAGDLVRISLRAETNDESMYWCFGPNHVLHNMKRDTIQIQGECIIGADGGSQLPLSRLYIGATDIELGLAGSSETSGGDIPEVLIIQAYVMCVSQHQDEAVHPIGRVLLKVDCGDDVVVTAQCAYQRSQYLTSVYKAFEL